MNYFPTYLALDNAFCNRQDELRRALYDLKGNTPILFISPRRYGKTSLALKAFEQIQWPYAHVDLYKAVSADDIEKFILAGIGKLLSQIESTPKKLLSLAADFFSNIQVKVLLGNAGLELEMKPRSDRSDVLLKSLEKLHDLVKQKNKRVILFLDEFQVVGEVIKNNSIEAAIREAAQKSTHVSYVFSGSNRHLMEQMFYDRKKPFYKLCDQIKLERIQRQAYEKYIQNAAMETWQANLSSQILDAIFFFTEYHSYYVNKLCSLLWQGGKPPTEEDVTSIWRNFVLENKSTVERELALLSLNQRKLLIFLANEEKIDGLFSKHTMQQINLAPGSVQKSIKALLEKDYILMNEQQSYQILDPLIKHVLCG